MRLLVIGMPALTAACLAGHVAPLRQEWKGRPASAVVAKWGQPQAVLSDRHGGKILVYIRDRQFTAPGEFATVNVPGAVDSTGTPAPPVPVTTYTPGPTSRYTEIVRFSVDSSGVIYEWSAKRQ